MESQRVAKLEGGSAAQLKIPHFGQLKLEDAQPVADWRAVLAKLSVTLHGLREGKALFFQVPEAVDVYSSTTASFFYNAQLMNVEVVYFVPIAMMYEYADELAKRPVCGCIVVSSTGRCGSTLLSQILETQSGVTSISEPLAWMHCASLLARPDAQIKDLGAWRREKVEAVMRACVLVQLKDFTASQFVCVKLHSQGASAVPQLASLFPKHRHVYLYRDPKPNVSSFVRVSKALLPGWVQAVQRLQCGRKLVFRYLMPLVFRGMDRLLFFTSGMMDDDVAWARDFGAWSREDGALLVLTWASNVRTALQFCRERHGSGAGATAGLKTLNYAALVGGHRSEACERLLQLCGLPASDAAVAAAVAAMSADSQENSDVSKSNTGDATVTYTPQQLALFDTFLADMGVPCTFSGELSLPNDLMGGMR